MLKEEKKRVITEFLERMAEKDIHLVEVGNFNKNMSMWSKNKPSDNAKTLISVSLKLERLNKEDVSTEIDKFLIR